jgi:hypothetical protein
MLRLMLCMDPVPATSEPDCPGCRAAVGTTETRCFLCGRLVPAEARIGPLPIPEEPLRFTFGLATLLLVITLFAIAFGLGAMHPGLGIVFGALATPAMVRTGLASARRRARGGAMGAEEKFLTFMASLGIVTAILTSTIAAFVATCFPVGLMAFRPDASGSAWLMGALGVGSLCGGLALWRMCRWLWPRKD